MTRQEFLKTIRKKLKALPAGEVKNSLAFYDEAISDRIDKGMTEEQAVAALGSPDEVAARIMEEMPEAEAAGEKRGARGGISWLLVILTSPIWFAVLIVMATVIPAAAACIIGLAAMLAALAVALPVCAVAALVACGALFYMNHWTGVLALGCAMALSGISILVWKLVWPLVRALGRGCVCACRACARGLSGVWGRICGRKV